ncbi:pterin-4-alpha-carbinolamine dehydratase 2 [Candidatus Endolissoclinum faulkneri L2]|uniref:Putative pterin-4-alpha-carbinolamine dehydratase n=1 Tax=Candidatus Endolissoclinum faulkneri L2 TaxID=1193729 RepID=K7ZD72_9PROT|nr:4a-hydroxytetrahydrobiopterin dehydratase [Candidatus Endolissoclinum faulkneri]AFX99256.1 pterin-4-alpha-carbinolamine dehydratase 2 [Candidatus Endolissoclinum faulkneri L2]
MVEKLSIKELNNNLVSMDGWTKTNDNTAIIKTFNFKSFDDAWNFMTQVAIKSSSMNHHPDWSNSYNKVIVELSTHNIGGVTDLDIELANYMDVTALDIRLI